MNRVKGFHVFAIFWLLFSSCSPKPVPPTPPVPVNLYTVKAQNVLYYDKFPGTVQALSQVDIRPEVQGYITGIFFTEGAHVQKGQKLYEIDIRLYQSALDQAVANLKVVQGNQEQAQQDADRYTYLNSKDAVAKQQYDHAIIALQNAKNQVKAAEEQVTAAKTNLTYAIITAPFDGTIGFSQVKLGNMVSVGQTILNTISSDNPMGVDFLINEAQLSRFDQYFRNPGKNPDSLFTIIMPDHSVYPAIGKISVIDRGVDPQTGTIRIRLEFANTHYSLRSGMSCVVQVHNNEATPQLVVPARAVIEQMGEYFVFVVKDTVIASHADSTNKSRAMADTAQGPKLRAFQRKIMLGQTVDANVIVKAGISEGDEIVVDGVQSLHEGSKVAVSKKEAVPGSAEANSKQQESKKKD